MAPTLTMTIVHLLDSEDTRCYKQPSVDVEVISFNYYYRYYLKC